MRIGHTCLTHSYLIEHTDPPKYTNYNQLLSIKHILTECTSYNQTRHQYYSFTDIKNILSLTPSQNMLNFIKKINLYDQL